MLTRPDPKKWPNREGALTQAVQRSGRSVPLGPFFFRQVRFQSVAQLEARENVQESVKYVLMELFLIKLRRRLRVEHAHYFCKTEGTRLRGRSCRGARFSLCGAGLCAQSSLKFRCVSS